MKIGASLYTSQQQAQVLAPQMIQSVQILQCGYDELQLFIQEQVEANPVLELAPAKSDDGFLNAPRSASFGAKGALTGSGDLQSLEERHSAPVSLHEHLRQQVMTAFSDAREQAIASEIIYSIDMDGYLRRPIGEMCSQLQIEEPEFEHILHVVQGFEPSGVGARSLAECLQIQLQARGQLNKSMRVLLDHLPLVASHHMSKLMRICGVSHEEIIDMVRKIRALVPKPGDCFDQAPAIIAVPDIYVFVDDNEHIKVELNVQALPRVLVDRVYESRITPGKAEGEEKQFITDCLQSARWLVRSLDQRAQTILKVASHIASHQRDFFISGEGYLRPLTMREVAEAVDLHETTISRAVAHKYIMTQRGLFEMKYFFSKAIAANTADGELSAHVIQLKIQQLIDAETADKILSDDAIAEKLQAEGIEIARRTVAKYREQLKINSSAQRRREKQRAG